MTVELISSRHGRAALGDATKAAILRAAMRVFAAQGFSGARIDAIAAEAGVNKALLYYHFEDKQALLTAVFVNIFEEIHGPILAALRAEGSARKALLNYVSLHFDALRKGPRLGSLQQHFMTADKVAEPLIIKYAQPRALALRELLERGIANGEFRPVDAGHTAISLTSLLVHYFSITPILKRIGTVDPTSEEQLSLRKREVVDFVRHALFADPHAPVP